MIYLFPAYAASSRRLLGRLRARFDRIFTKKTGYILLDQKLRRLHYRKEHLLRVLDRAEIPLHTNASENDILSMATRCKISGGTMSDPGKAARDTMLGLMKSCAKLKLSFYRFLGNHFGIQSAPFVEKLPMSSGSRPHSCNGICTGYTDSFVSIWLYEEELYSARLKKSAKMPNFLGGRKSDIRYALQLDLIRGR